MVLGIGLRLKMCAHNITAACRLLYVYELLRSYEIAHEKVNTSTGHNQMEWESEWHFNRSGVNEKKQQTACLFIQNTEVQSRRIVHKHEELNEKYYSHVHEYACVCVWGSRKCLGQSIAWLFNAITLQFENGRHR